MSLVNIPTKLEEISSQGVRQIASDCTTCSRCRTPATCTRGAAAPRASSASAAQVVPGAAARVGDDAEGRAPDRGGRRALARAHVQRPRLLVGLVAHGQLGHGNRKTQLHAQADRGARRAEAASARRRCGCSARARATRSRCSATASSTCGAARLWQARAVEERRDTEPFLIEALVAARGGGGAHRQDEGARARPRSPSCSSSGSTSTRSSATSPTSRPTPEAALFLSKAVADDLHKRASQLQADLEQARKDNETLLEKFIADQEEAFKEKEQEGLEKLQSGRGPSSRRSCRCTRNRRSSRGRSRRCASRRAGGAPDQADRQGGEGARGESLPHQARTADKARRLNKSLRLAARLAQAGARGQGGGAPNATRQAALAQEELEQAQKELSVARVDIKKHEKQGFKASIEKTHSLVAQVVGALAAPQRDVDREHRPRARARRRRRDSARRRPARAHQDLQRGHRPHLEPGGRVLRRRLHVDVKIGSASSSRRSSSTTPRCRA